MHQFPLVHDISPAEPSPEAEDLEEEEILPPEFSFNIEEDIFYDFGNTTLYPLQKRPPVPEKWRQGFPARHVEAVRDSRQAGKPRHWPKRRQGPTAGAAPLFGRERRRKKSSKGGFLIFQNFRGLTEKKKFPLI